MTNISQTKLYEITNNALKNNSSCINNRLNNLLSDLLTDNLIKHAESGFDYLTVNLNTLYSDLSGLYVQIYKQNYPINISNYDVKTLLKRFCAKRQLKTQSISKHIIKISW